MQLKHMPIGTNRDRSSGPMSNQLDVLNSAVQRQAPWTTGRAGGTARPIVLPRRRPWRSSQHLPIQLAAEGEAKYGAEEKLRLAIRVLRVIEDVGAECAHVNG